MTELGLTGAVRGKVKRTTIADPAAARPADLVQRRFAPPAPNRLWVADLTYVSTWSGFAYVAFVTDAYARRILGWRVASTMTTAMVLDGIEQAIWTRQREGLFDLKDVVHHTDRGSQYTSIRFTERLAEAGIQPSVGAVGSSYDNALAETINGLYKTELIKPRKPWRTIEEVELATAEWVDWFGYAGDLRRVSRDAARRRGCCGREVVVFVPCLVRPVDGRAAAGASAARRLSGDGRGPGASEHGAGHRVRSEGLLLGGRQGAGGGHRRRRAGVHRGAAAAAARRDGGADRGRRGGLVGAHDQASPGLGHRAVRVSDHPWCRCEKSSAAWVVDEGASRAGVGCR